MTIGPDVIAALEAALSEARAGRVVAIGVVKVFGPGLVQCVAAGPAVAETYLGCGMLQNVVLTAMQQKPSPIVRPAAVFNGGAP